MGQEEYFVLHNGETKGPYSIEEVFSKLDSGEINHSDSIYDKDRDEWILIMQFPEIMMGRPDSSQSKEKDLEGTQAFNKMCLAANVFGVADDRDNNFGSNMSNTDGNISINSSQGKNENVANQMAPQNLQERVPAAQGVEKRNDKSDVRVREVQVHHREAQNLQERIPAAQGVEKRNDKSDVRVREVQVHHQEAQNLQERVPAAQGVEKRNDNLSDVRVREVQVHHQEAQNLQERVPAAQGVEKRNDNLSDVRVREVQVHHQEAQNLQERVPAAQGVEKRNDNLSDVRVREVQVHHQEAQNLQERVPAAQGVKKRNDNLSDVRVREVQVHRQEAQNLQEASQKVKEQDDNIVDEPMVHQVNTEATVFDNSYENEDLELFKLGWYVLKGGKDKFGPFLFTDIIKMLQEKSVFEFDFVWNPTLPTWKKIAEIPLFSPTYLNQLKITTMPEVQDVFFRRKYVRTSYTGIVLIHDSEKVWEGQGLNIGSGGARVAMEHSVLDLGKLFHLHFQSDNKILPFNAICEIMNKRAKRGVLKDKMYQASYGLRFKNIIVQKS